MSAAIAVIALAFVGAEEMMQARPLKGTTAGDPSPRVDGSTLSSTDRLFLGRTAELEAGEVKFSERALRQATRPDVRELAGQLLADHRRSEAGFRAIAASKGVVIAPGGGDAPAEPKPGERLGTDFDATYLARMVETYEDKAELYEQAALQCDDRDLTVYAARMLPSLQARRARTRELKKSLD